MTLRSEPVGLDPCDLSRRWALDPLLAAGLVRLEAWARDNLSPAGLGRDVPFLRIISGYRSPSLQDQINPSNPQSRHTVCPSLAADLRVGNTPAGLTPTELWATLGARWQLMGGTWGGTFQGGFAGGTSPDVNHFQIG